MTECWWNKSTNWKAFKNTSIYFYCVVKMEGIKKQKNKKNKQKADKPTRQLFKWTYSWIIINDVLNSAEVKRRSWWRTHCVLENMWSCMLEENKPDRIQLHNTLSFIPFTSPYSKCACHLILFFFFFVLPCHNSVLPKSRTWVTTWLGIKVSRAITV